MYVIHNFFVFSQVASYDFVIPVSINHTMAPTPAPSTFPPTPAPSHMNWTISELMTPAPSLVDVATPSRRVVATALRPPLQMSHSVLEFRLPSGYFELGIESGAGRAQVCHSSPCSFFSCLFRSKLVFLYPCNQKERRICFSWICESCRFCPSITSRNKFSPTHILENTEL